jgi:hypothetical protein
LLLGRRVRTGGRDEQPADPAGHLGLFSSFGDQQEQPFMQVNADRGVWIKWQRLVAISIGWRPMLMSSETRTNEPARLWDLLGPIAMGW